jgi:hypothetical protein
MGCPFTSRNDAKKITHRIEHCKNKIAMKGVQNSYLVEIDQGIRRPAMFIFQNGEPYLSVPVHRQQRSGLGGGRRVFRGGLCQLGMSSVHADALGQSSDRAGAWRG